MNAVTAVAPTRRQVLQGFGAGALVLAVPVSAVAQAVPQAPADAAATPLGVFIRIGADGGVTLVAPCSELGQGSHTALAMILADELGADWSRVRVEAPPLGVPYRVPGRPVQNTSGSQMVRRWHEPLRKSAAAAREMLTTAAAQQWSVPVSQCTVEQGLVVHGASGRRAAFGELAAKAAALPVPAAPVLRTSHSLIGSRVARVDVPSKVDGSAVYGADVHLPGMVYAAIRQSPVYSAKLVSVDKAPIAGMRGIVDVVHLPDAVAVVADNFWRAKRAVEALTVRFGPPALQATSSRDILATQRLQLDAPYATSALQAGEAKAALAASKTVLQRDYAVPFLHHATMEPMTCTVDLSDGRCRIWVSTQNLTGAADAAVRLAKVPLDKVTVNAMLVGGGFGRKFEQDFVEQAIQIAMAVKRPVKLLWTREEDVQHGFYRPAMSARVVAGLDAQGDVTGMRLRLVGPSVLEHTIGNPLIRGVDPVAMLGVTTESPAAPGAIQQYSIKQFLAEYVYQPSPVPVGYWRSVGASENGFFIESFIDELADQAKQDRYAFRRRLLRESPRALAVLDKVALEGGWGKPRAAGRHLGIAFSECVGSMVAQVVEASVRKGQVQVHRVVCAIDCGTAIHPDNVRAQVEGSIVMALSATLGEQITIDQGRCVQSNFHDYPVLRLRDAPRIDVHIVESGAALGGVGEAAVPALAPALCSALHAATGVRIRQLPVADRLARGAKAQA